MSSSAQGAQARERAGTDREYAAFLDAVSPLCAGDRVVDVGGAGPANLHDLPFPDASVGAACLFGVLEHVAASDLERTIAELGRVTSRTLYVHVDRTSRAPLASLSREDWERHFLAADWSKHPLSQRLTPYEQLEHDGAVLLMAFERLPPPARSAYPLTWLHDERYLHMDMLRATGRRSDAHIARYDLAAQFVRDEDTILDAACGLGYGTALLHDSASNAIVTGLDLSESVIAYARATFGSRRPRTSFEAGDVMTVRARPDASLDLVVSFETLEHIEEPDAFVAEVARVLKPGGRLICSIPNRWVDHTGRDPNPFHLHVFDLERLTSLLQAHLRIDHTFAQFAGGGMKHPAAARRFVPVPPGDEDDAEWWVAVATKGDAASGDGERPRFQRDRVDLLAADCRRHERALHTLQEQHADVTAQLDRYRGEHEVLTCLLNRRRERIIARALTDARGVAIFGAGEGGRQAAGHWRAQGGRVAVFTDNRASLWGTTLADVPIVPPATLPVRDVALIVVASSIGAADIATQLEGMGLCRDVDFMTP